MKRTRGLGALAALLAILTLGACGSGMYRQPEITLQNVHLGSLGLRGGTLLVDLRVVNPNRFALHANTLNYDLLIADSRQPGDTAWIDFASGVVDLTSVRRLSGAAGRESDTVDPERGFSVRGRDSVTVQIPVEFSYSGIGSAAASTLRFGTFNYNARGTVNVRTPIGPYTVPFQRRGAVSMLGAAR